MTPEMLQLAAGLLLGLFGWTLYWGGLHVLGGLLGAALGSGIGWLIVRAGEIYDSSMLILAIAAALGAVIGVFLIRQIHRGFFLLSGALVGLIVGLQMVVLLQESINSEWLKPTGAATGILVGTFSFLMLSRHIIIVITAFFAALLIATSHAFRDPLLIFLIGFFTSLILQTGVVKFFGFRR